VRCRLLMCSEAMHEQKSRMTSSHAPKGIEHPLASPPFHRHLYLVCRAHYPERYARVETGTPYESANKPSARISRYAIVWGMSCQVSSNRIKTYQGGIQLSNIRANGL
jgi:hypothetical protein